MVSENSGSDNVYSKNSSNHNSKHYDNMLRLQNKNDVYKKYESLDIIGSGSMGHLEKVRIRESKVGGSAFNPKPKGFLAKLKYKLKKAATKDDQKPPNAKLSEHGPIQEYVYALKSIHLDRISTVFLEEIQNECSILRTMDHPNVIKAYEVFYTKKQIYIVMELCDGGDLYTRTPYTERDAARITAKICSAINYLHDKGIVHRDLKFENILFENKEQFAEPKIIDFGLSKKFLGKPGFMTERVGTIYTMAPQVLQGVYSSKADMWSVGVIAYMLLSSSKPFYSKKRRKMIDLIMRGTVSFSSPVWNNISTNAQDFVKQLLIVDPKKRLDAASAMQHPWIVNREELCDELPKEEVLKATVNSFLNYQQTSHLKKLALNVIAHRSTSTEILELRKAFAKYDTSNNGVLSYDEFKQALSSLNMNEDDLDQIFSSIDFNQNGHIMWTEFLAATIEAHCHIEEDRIAEAFDRLDSDDTGYISKGNLREVMGEDCSEEEIDAIIKAADVNKDGKISYPEFLESFRTQTLAAVQNVIDEDSFLSSENLLGLDAVIPGGKYDSTENQNGST